jgi:hypothetical protein
MDKNPWMTVIGNEHLLKENYIYEVKVQFLDPKTWLSSTARYHVTYWWDDQLDVKIPFEVVEFKEVM